MIDRNHDIPMDFDTMAAAGTMAGSGGVIIIDDTRDIAWVLNNINAFYAHESCGQCTPCREGSLWMKKISDRIVAGVAVPEDRHLERVAYKSTARRSAPSAKPAPGPPE